MASNPNFPNVTYAGEHYAEIFGPAVIDPAGLVDQNLATPMDNAKFKGTVNEADDTVEFQNPNPKFNGQTSQASMPEVNLEAVPYEVHKELRWDDIRKSWFAGQLGAGSLNDYTADFVTEQFISKVYMPKVKLANANLLLRGKAGLASSIGSYTFSATYVGLYGKIEAAANTNKIAATIGQIAVATVAKGTTTTLNVASNAADSLEIGNIVSIRGAAGTGWTAMNGEHVVLAKTATTVVIDYDSDALTNGNYTGASAAIQFINSSNIIQVMKQVLSRVPVAVRRNPNVKMVLPSHLELEWQFANAEVQQNGGGYFLNSYEKQFIDKQVVILDQAPDNTVGVWTPERVFNIFDLEDDVANAKLIWMGDTTADFVYRLRFGIKSGVQITTQFQREITLYRPFKA
jgi:hypothetical protein